MSDSLFLDRDEIAVLTGRQRSGCQARILKTMGVEHRMRPDGRVLVLRKHVEQIFGAPTQRRAPVEVEPDWSAI